MPDTWSWDTAFAGFVERWRRRPAAFEGSLAIYNLAWLARVGDGKVQPFFPEALTTLRAQQRLDGSIGPETGLALCRFVVGLSVANTLIARGCEEAEIRAAIDHAMRALADLGTPPVLEAPQYYGDHFHFDGLFTYWVVPIYEVEALLATGDAWVVPEEQAALARAIAAHREGPGRRWLESLDHGWCFEANLQVVYCAEVFPAATFSTPGVRSHSALARGLPGFTVPVAARYVEATGDPMALARLRTLASRPLDGLWPTGGQLELVFAMWYLVRGGVDVRRHCPIEVARFSRLIARATGGMSFYDGALGYDCDTSAVVLYAAHILGLKIGYSLDLLDRRWIESSDCYIGFEDTPMPGVSTEVHVLDAFMAAPDISWDRKRHIWQRTIRLLENRPWREQFHVSPLYIWELIVGMGFRYSASFPDDPTSVHLTALDLVLQLQQEDGGFRSAYAPRTNPEETALALLALCAAETSLPIEHELTGRVARAAMHARAFLKASWPPGPETRTELWVGKVLTAPPNMIDAIVLSSLANEPCRYKRPLPHTETRCD